MGRKNRQNKQKPFERPADYPRKNRSQKAKREPWIKVSQIPFGIIILAYIFVGTFTPNWMALDTNATKFMTLAFLNLGTFLYLLTCKDVRKNPGVLQQFFDTKLGLAYTGFLVVAL